MRKIKIKIPLTGIKALLILIVGISCVTGNQYMVPTGRHNYITVSVLIGACVNFPLNLLLIGRFQAIGEAFAIPRPHGSAGDSGGFCVFRGADRDEGCVFLV